MNRPATVIAYVNLAHFLDHYAMLIFPTALIVMAPILGKGYGDLLPFATPGFVAFGAGSLVTGWLGDVWSRRYLMLIFFLGLGVSLFATGLTSTPGQLALGLFSVGAFASIYHPVGTAMLVACAPKLGREIGINGVYGNLGVACVALVTGVLCQFFGWRVAFFFPGLISIVVGVFFSFTVRYDEHRPSAQVKWAARISRDAMWRVFAALIVTVIASSTIFNAVTVALPKLFSERLVELTTSPAWLGMIMAGVYVFGAVSQYTIGGLIDRYGLRAVFLPFCFVMAPVLFVTAHISGWALVATAVVLVIVMFGQATINDAMVGKYTSDKWRSRAYATRYFVGFTAAGGSIALVAALYDHGGFSLLLRVLSALSALIIVGGIVFPREHPAIETAIAAE